LFLFVGSFIDSGFTGAPFRVVTTSTPEKRERRSNRFPFTGHFLYRYASLDSEFNAGSTWQIDWERPSRAWASDYCRSGLRHPIKKERKKERMGRWE